MTTTCCYKNCTRNATEYDCDGDEACEFHAAQSERWVIVTDLTNGNWIDADGATEVERLLEEQGWDVEIRSARRGECGDSTYRHNGDGTLRIMMHGCEPLDEAVRVAWDKAMTMPRSA